MAIELPKPLADLASRTDGQISFLLRLGSILLCVISMATAIPSITLIGDLFLVFPGSFILFWDLVYLILIALDVNVGYPVIITFDLCSWLLAVAMDVLSIPVAFWLHRCASGDVDDDCSNLKEGGRLAAASWILAILLVVIHFILFVRAIMVLRRQKRAVAKGIPLQNAVAFSA